MPIPSVLRTTSFRLTLLYAALFFGSVLLLFAAMYVSGTGFIANQIAIATRAPNTASERLAFIPRLDKWPGRLIRARGSANSRPSHSAGEYRRSRDDEVRKVASTLFHKSLVR